MKKWRTNMKTTTNGHCHVLRFEVQLYTWSDDSSKSTASSEIYYCWLGTCKNRISYFSSFYFYNLAEFQKMESLKCSLRNSKRSFYSSFNAIFGKVGRLAAEPVTVELLKSKCLPSLYYGLEECPLSSADFKSLEYVVVGTFVKIFNTRSKEIATSCMEMFNFPLPLACISNRKSNFMRKLYVSDKSFVGCVLNILVSLILAVMYYRPSIVWTVLSSCVRLHLQCSTVFCFPTFFLCFVC